MIIRTTFGYISIMLLIFIFLGVFTSCTKQNNKNKAHQISKDTIYKFYDEKDSIIKLKAWNINDSVFYLVNFDKRGQIKSKGSVLHDSIEYGKWIYYKNRANEKIKEIKEYKLIDGDVILNQDWIVNAKNDTIWGRHITHTQFKDSYTVGDTVEIKYYYPMTLISENSELYLVLSKKGNFNKTFSNIESLTLDTIPNVYRINKYKDKSYRKYKRAVYLSYVLDSVGKKNIRHIFLERFDTIYNDTSSTSFTELYFDKEIFVKDSIN